MSTRNQTFVFALTGDDGPMKLFKAQKSAEKAVHELIEQTKSSAWYTGWEFTVTVKDGRYVLVGKDTKIRKGVCLDLATTMRKTWIIERVNVQQ